MSEQMQQRIAELEAVEQMRDEELAVTKERHGNALIECDQLRQQLLVAQAEVKRLREALKKANAFVISRNYGYGSFIIEALHRELCDALSTPSDTSAIDALQRDAERSRYMIGHAEWHRHDDEDDRPYALLAVRLPFSADLSCSTTRENAIDAAIGANHE